MPWWGESVDERLIRLRRRPMQYDRLTRWLHAGIVLAVMIQLTSSQLMQVPQPGHSLAGTGIPFFSVHRWSGMCVLSLAVLHWLWGLSGHVTNGWGHLFPWFSRSRLGEVLSAIKAMPAWLQGKLPVGGQETIPLAGLVHGLGLLLITAMALTGSAIFFGMSPDGSMPRSLEPVRPIHGFIANFVWVYFFGHAGMAALHQWKGEPLITRMFNLAAR
jgi:cytochrome b561